MPQHERNLPVTCPSDLRQTGHVLFKESGDTLNQIFLALYQKKYRREIKIGLFDFTPEQHLVKVAENIIDDDDNAVLEYQVSDIETARRALEELDIAFAYRKKTPSASGIWILLIDGLTEMNWEVFRLYLNEGKRSSIYVIAAIKDPVTPWLPEHLFDTVVQGNR